MTRLLILYHASCQDGFTAAWCAWRKFGDDADYVPVQHGVEPSVTDVAGRDLYILDFSYDRDTLLRLNDAAASLTLLDHHKTAMADLADFGSLPIDRRPRIVFDLDRCGAHLAWSYFFPDRPVPPLVRLVEARDLWRWNVPNARPLDAWLGSMPRDFATWNQIYKMGDLLDCKSHVEQGNAILRYQAIVVDSQCDKAAEVEMDGYKILTVNATVLISDICGKLAQGRPFAMTWFETGSGMRVHSLRSDSKGIDVSAVAKRRGGGGHFHAAGYQT